MFDESSPLVQFKLDILKHALPAEDAIVFGDMYVVEGGYTAKCIDLGCVRATLVDTVETQRWLDLRKRYPTINFYKGDFSNSLFMKSFNETYDLGVVYDILLHQAPLINTLHLMLEKVRRRFCIVQPMLREQKYPNTLIYLPGNPNFTDLYPMQAENAEFQMFDVHEVNHSHWQWAMTRSFLHSLLAGEGFDVIHEQEASDLPNPNWYWYGCVVERRRINSRHWSLQQPYRDLLQTDSGGLKGT